MSITDPIKIYYYERRETYMLLQGRETFYDENNVLLEWDTSKEAIEWARKNHPNTELVIPIEYGGKIQNISSDT